MARVVVEGPEPTGLARMIAQLVEANIEADPSAERILESTRGAVQLEATDVGETVGLKFVPGALTVTSGPVAGSDLTVSADSATLLGLPTVPLRFGLPDPLTDQGRALAATALRGGLRVRGLPFGLPMLLRLQRLLSVAR